MASETETQPAETSSVFDRVFRNRDVYLFLPFVLGFSNRETQQNPDRESTEIGDSDIDSNNNSSRERIILVNPFTQGMVVIEGSSSVDSLLRNLANNHSTNGKDGQPPASKASIDAMPRVEIGEGDDRDGECVICLEEWVAGDVAKEMPCKHRFHGKCIGEWLEIRGSCPICRYKMPVDEEEVEKKRDGEREIWVSFSFNGDGNGGRRSGESDQSNDSSTDNGGSGSISVRETDS